MNLTLKALETLGKTAGFAHLSEVEVVAILNPLNVDAEVQQAIVDRNVAKLEALLDVRNKIVCMINQPEPEEAPVDQPEPDEDSRPEQVQACS